MIRATEIHLPPLIKVSSNLVISLESIFVITMQIIRGYFRCKIPNLIDEGDR